MNITKHFTLQEFQKTSTGFLNLVPRMEYCFNIARLCEWLEFVRMFVDCPIIITSGFRSEKVNEAVGGAKNSYHLRGLAVDFKTQDPAMMDKAFQLLQSNKSYFDKIPEHSSYRNDSYRIVELIKEPTWIHLAIEDLN